MMHLGDTMNLRVQGLGIVMYSPYAVAHLTDGEDYFSEHYVSSADVQRHVQAGDLVGFGTGSPGDYRIRLCSGYPRADRLASCDMKLRIAIVARSGVVHFRDMFDLMEWDFSTPEQQILCLEDGVYHLTLCSDVPDSGLLGDSQEIEIYFNALSEFPALARQGVPSLV